ncbi:MAG: ribosome silencing factor [Actinomycetia bacterium]|nr:ribosome silencing factor [Actinomycetes bacterium]MCP4958470.1 ribosome silencing factor [Actinomycetes bacterium]
MSQGSSPEIERDELPLLVQAAAQGASELKADDIVVLDVGDILGVTDYFIIASAPNVRQVRRIAEEMEEHVKRAGGDGTSRAEGTREGMWVLLDFGAFIGHVFHTESRTFYDLERLWSEAPRHHWVDTAVRPGAPSRSLSTTPRA